MIFHIDEKDNGLYSHSRDIRHKVNTYNVRIGHFSLEGRRDKIVYFSSFQIFKKYRGRGYGKQFLLKLIEELSVRYNGIELFCERGNLIARQLYTSLGFKQIGDYGNTTTVFKLVFNN